MKKLNLIGQRFGRLVVVKNLDPENGRTYSLCHCDCGNDVKVCNKFLRNGHIQSCGCLKIDHCSKLGKKNGSINIKKAQEKAKEVNTIHNHSNTRLHRIWVAMRQRCNNPNNFSYSYYGDNGITVCEEWNDYLTFEKWAFDNGYQDNLTIDRINSSKGYNPSNCRWITQSENSKRAGELNKRFWAVNADIGVYAEFGNLKKFLEENAVDVSYSQAQDIIKGKVKSKNGWIFGKE